MARQKAGRGASQRQLRVGEMVRHAVADMLVREVIDDPQLTGGHVTVTEARMSPDLRHATVFVRPFAADGDGPALIAALKQHQRFMRGELSKRLELKFAPDLIFRLDKTFDTADRITALLRSPDVARDLD